ncbi:MAG: nodulation protein NfeD [Candidatus Aminicenantes bacterium]|nr:MAG: nodulation protein NfeD [Candidatus Aminicenantes bacterium]
MKNLKKLIFLFFLYFLIIYPLQARVYKITINAPIHPVTSEFIRQAIDQAERDQAKLLIMALNTPGGLDSSMREIIERILSSKVPIAAYVSPNGARAASAGFFICLACDIFVMAPGTSTGAAHPVGISLTGQQMDETMAAKVTEDAAAHIRTIAEKRGRNVKMAEEAVTQSRSYTETEALKGGLIDLIAANEEDILKHFDQRTIKRFSGETIQLQLQDETIEEISMSARQKFLLTISNPNLAYILLMLGLLGLYFEFSNPGAILPGVLGGISLLLAIFAFQILPINYVGLLLILLAIGLFILEIKVQSYGILSIGGIMAMVLGSIMLINSPIPELRPSLNFIIPVAIGLSLIFIFLIMLVVRAHSRKVMTGKEGLIGEIGTAQTDLNPEGKVFVHGELWHAEAEENIPQGSKVKVIEVKNGLKIKVTKV